MVLFDACKLRFWGKARDGAVTIDIGFIRIGDIAGSLFLFTTDTHAGGHGRWFCSGRFYLDMFYVRGFYHAIRNRIKYKKLPGTKEIIIDE